MKKILFILLTLFFMFTGIANASYYSITIQPGETLQQIVNRELYDTSYWRSLLEYNNISSPSQIQPGVVMRIPYSLSIIRVARINSTIGSCQLYRNDSWQSVYTNMIIIQGDRLRTGESSRLSLELDDGTIVHLRSSAIISIPSLDYVNGNRTTRIALDYGSLMARVTRLSGDAEFNVATPTVVAGVRGTIMNVDVRQGGEIVSCLSGNIEVEYRDENIEVNDGRAFIINPYGEYNIIDIPSRIQWIE